jgi:hypothetical protein
VLLGRPNRALRVGGATIAPANEREVGGRFLCSDQVGAYARSAHPFTGPLARISKQLEGSSAGGGQEERR